jgi:hypothetical protein
MLAMPKIGYCAISGATILHYQKNKTMAAL